MTYRICVVYHTRIGSHETVDIGPYLKHVGFECCRNDCRSVVTTATSKICNLITILILRNEARNNNYLFGTVVEMFVYQFFGLVACKDVVATLYLGLYELTCIVTHCTIYQCSHNTARQSLAIAYDCSFSLGRHIVDERKTVIYVIEFIKQLIDLNQQLFAPILTWYDAVYKFVVTCHNLLELLLESLITVHRHIGCLYQFVGYTTESRHNDNEILIRCRILDNAFEVQYTVYGTH